MTLPKKSIIFPNSLKFFQKSHFINALFFVEIVQGLIFFNFFINYFNKLTKELFRAPWLAAQLRKHGWPSEYISGSQEQESRLKAISSLKDFQLRVLVSTDLVSANMI